MPSSPTAASPDRPRSASARGACRETGDASSGSARPQAWSAPARRGAAARPRSARGSVASASRSGSVGGVVDRRRDSRTGRSRRIPASVTPRSPRQRQRQHQHQPAVGRIAHRDGDRLSRRTQVPTSRCSAASQRGAWNAVARERCVQRAVLRARRKSKAGSTATASRRVVGAKTSVRGAKFMRPRFRGAGARKQCGMRQLRAARLPRRSARVARENRISSAMQPQLHRSGT